MAERRLLVRWSLANAIGMSLGFLAFIQTLMFLTFGLDFGLVWSSEVVEDLNLRMLRKSDCFESDSWSGYPWLERFSPLARR